MDWQSRIAQGEKLDIEFKSDRQPLPDRELIEAVVCMANCQGGWLFLGIEDDGTVTGLHPNHRAYPEQMAALIANRTFPPLSVQVVCADLPSGEETRPVAILGIPRSPHPTATSDGRVLIRYLDIHARPACRPLYPNELASWRSDRGKIDVTARPVDGATWDDLDPLEIARLRRMIKSLKVGATTIA